MEKEMEKETFASLRQKAIGKGKLMNILTDIGFKRVFGTESNKDILIMFLNQILGRYFNDDKPPIVDVELQNTEQIPLTIYDKKIIYDIKCTDKKGRKFIVEMQRGESENLYNRLEYYVSKSLINQIQSGGDYDIKSSYLICIADFDSAYIPHFRSDHYNVCAQDGKQYFFGSTIVLIQLRKLNKKFAELENFDEIWGYLLKNIIHMENMPPKLKQIDKGFEKLFDVAKLESMTTAEREAYELYLDNIAAYNFSLKSGIKRAMEKGMEKGMESGIQKERLGIAKKMKEANLSLEMISQCSGLTIEQIKGL